MHMTYLYEHMASDPTFQLK